MQAATALQPKLAESSKAHLIWVPGRLEIAGKHTDYAGGRSLIAPTEQGIAMIAVPRSDRHIFVVDARSQESFELSLDEQTTNRRQDWQTYFVEVARRLEQNFPSLSRGANLSFISSLPAAAGLSSSSSLVVGAFLALARVNSLQDRKVFRQAIPTREALAGYLGAVENGYSHGSLEGAAGVGTFGGSEDHTAILCGEEGCIVQYSYSPVRFERSIKLPTDLVFVIAASGIQAKKTGSAMAEYNRLSLQSRAVAEVWRKATGRDLSDLGSILAADRGAADTFGSLGGHLENSDFTIDELISRFQHFEQENEVIVPGAAKALEADDLGRFGEWIDESMHLAESLLGNQIAETSFLATKARQLGAVAASAFGAGFGGAVWALVPRDEAEKFKYHFREAYWREFPQHRDSATFFLTDAGAPAMEITPDS